MKTFQAKRVTKHFTRTIAASRSEIFPLLCPVREHEWIDGWTCEMIYSETGVAENNCVFKTSFPRGVEETWVVSHYDTEGFEIRFAVVNPEGYVMKLDISLQERGDDSTDMSWTNNFTGLTPEGNEFIANYDGETYAAAMQGLFAALEHYLRTGQMLKIGPRHIKWHLFSRRS
ncbi:MAG: hypothetical protein HY912_05590 [Desulfomonile tiedjei]|uniref:Uncharacterized protein n=1 Tax=Desulfomonile tiedjei TaxID=2358 RepID=A0A9D6V1E7_9BACT|nr:hypothetical protein [Desulfomonile tiedjei]